MTNNCGAVKLAATVWPGSMLRVRTMPSMGDLMTALLRSFSLMRTLRLCGGDCGLGGGEIRAGALRGGVGAVDDRAGGHLAAAEALELDLTREEGLGLGDGGLGEDYIGLRGFDGGAIALGLLGELGGVQLDEGLAFGDAVIDVGEDFKRDAGELAADGDGIGGLEIAGGGDGEADVSAHEGLGDVGGQGIAGLLNGGIPEPSTDAEKLRR